VVHRYEESIGSSLVFPARSARMKCDGNQKLHCDTDH
jgi:hypothetical protein